MTVPCKNVVVLGDSISAGYPLPINQMYMSLLQNGITQYNTTFYQYSIGGLTTDLGLMTATKIYEYGVNPNLVILAMGINDVIKQVPAAQIAQNLEQIAMICMGHGTPVILGNIDLTAWEDLTPPGYPQAFNSALQQVINTYGFMTFDFLDWKTLAANGPYCIDRIHPNAAGHAAIAAELNPKVISVLNIN